MTKAVSEQINEIEPERWTEMMAKVDNWFDHSKTYTIRYSKTGKFDIECTAPTEKKVKELLLFALEFEKC